MQQIPKMLILGGIVLIVIGVIWYFGSRFLPIGKLPGDVVVRKENFTFNFPIVTCIVISVVLSLLFTVIRWFTK